MAFFTELMNIFCSSLSSPYGHIINFIMNSLWTYYGFYYEVLMDILQSYSYIPYGHITDFLSWLLWYFLRISFTPGERRGMPPTTPTMPHVPQSCGLPGGACQWPRGSTYETAWRCPSTSGHRMASPTRPNRPVGRPFRLYGKRYHVHPKPVLYCTLRTVQYLPFTSYTHLYCRTPS